MFFKLIKVHLLASELYFLYYVYPLLRATKYFIWQVQEKGQNANLTLADFYLHGFRKIFDKNYYYFFFFNFRCDLKKI